MAQLCLSSGSLTRMRGLPSLRNLIGSEQIIFLWVLAGRISNMVKVQLSHYIKMCGVKVEWRYREGTGPKIVDEVHCSSMEECRYKCQKVTQKCFWSGSTPIYSFILWVYFRYLVFPMVVSYWTQLLSSTYMQQYLERLIMTKPSISNSCFHIWCKFCFPRFNVLIVVLMRIQVCCTVTLLSGSHHSEGPYYLHLPRLSPAAWHEPFTQ